MTSNRMNTKELMARLVAPRHLYDGTLSKIVPSQVRCPLCNSDHVGLMSESESRSAYRCRACKTVFIERYDAETAR